MATNLRKDFEDINNLKSNKIKHKKSADETLIIAKQQEAEKMKNGCHYVTIDVKTKVLRKIE